MEYFTVSCSSTSEQLIGSVYLLKTGNIWEFFGSICGKVRIHMHGKCCGHGSHAPFLVGVDQMELCKACALLCPGDQSCSVSMLLVGRWATVFALWGVFLLG